MYKTKRIIWGIVIILIGLILGARATGFVDFDLTFNGWWTFLIIVPGVIGLFTHSDKTMSIAAITVGVAMLLGTRGIIDYEILAKLIGPAIIVFVGIKVIMNTFNGRSQTKMLTDGKNKRICCAAFSGHTLNLSGEVFEGAELTATFGGIKCDLRDAVFNGDTIITVNAIFGGIDIFVPENVNVKSSATSLFGGVGLKGHTNKPENTVTLYVNGLCLFGGVDIR